VHTKIDPKLGPRTSLQQSLRRLCRASVDVLYFHDPDAVLTGSGEVIRTALPLRESGEALALGTSVYSIDALRASLTHPHVDVVQIPVNPLQPALAAFAQNKQCKQIFGRSLLAQGLLTASPENLPPSTAHLEPSITAFQSACNELGRTPLEVALLWSRDHPSLDGLIIGAASIAQLRETSTILSSPSLSLDERALIDAVNQPTGATMDPRTWR
jgi:D-threo-aldose 1-dehydrogenase